MKKNPSDVVLCLTLKPKHLDLVTGVLCQLGVFHLEEKHLQGRLQVICEIPSGVSSRAFLGNLQKLKRQGILPVDEMKTFQIPREPWVKAYQKHLKPFLLFKPSTKTARTLWIDPREDAPLETPPDQTLKIEAGLAFGTGAHPTTQLVARLLEEFLLAHPRVSVLDLGCGTGILAMIAKKLGAKQVDGIDNDPVALEVAEANFKKNQIGGIQLGLSLERCRKKYDLIVANILLATHLELKDLLLKRLKPNGAVIFGGLLYKDCAELLEHYAELSLVERKNSKGWSALFMRRV